MTTLGKVLAALNLVGVIAMLVLASSSLRARNDWALAMENLEKARDGDLTDSLVASVGGDARQAIAAGAKSDYAQRRMAAAELFKAHRENPFTRETQQLANRTGAEVMKEVVQGEIRVVQSAIVDEQKLLASQKLALLTQQARLQDLIAARGRTVTRLQTDLVREQQLEAGIQEENIKRRTEIARLRMDLEEALAAQAVAESRAREIETYVERTTKRGDELAARNADLATQLEGQVLGR